MTIVVGYIPSPQGEAALDRAISLARDHDEDLVVLNSYRGDALVERHRVDDGQLPALEGRLTASGVRYSVRREARSKQPAEEILAVAEEVSAGTIVIGIRRRTPTGKLIFGSTAQRVLLEADCDVLAVKAGDGS